MNWLTLLVALAFAQTDDKLADGEFTIGPTYTNAPELTVKDGVPRGAVAPSPVRSLPRCAPQWPRPENGARRR